ncbi:MAG: hypothetical protein KIS77_02880 [Saprospiraceae bacterium]|nr:hypothetical protein [Saprospiraceae bacterium]
MTYQVHIKPIYWFLLAILLVLGVWSYSVWASYGYLPSTVAKLKNEVELLKAPADSAKSSTTLDMQKLELKIDRVETSIRNDFVLIQKLGIPLTVIAFVLMFWSVYKSALGFALERAKETVDRYYLPDEERFKREKKLLVLTKEGSDSGFIRQMLKDTGFLAAATIPDNVKRLDEDTLYNLLDGGNYDLIFFNNEVASDAPKETPNPFSDDELLLCLDRTSSGTMIFHFGRPNLSQTPMANRRVASAGFKSQIYGNLINALKYQQYLRKPSTTKQA